MSTAYPPKSWVRPEEWAAHRTVITRLYCDENKTLHAVMQHMEQEHGFHATARMYKARLSQWGITKNNRRGPVPADAVTAWRLAPTKTRKRAVNKEKVAELETSRAPTPVAVLSPRRVLSQPDIYLPVLDNLRAVDRLFSGLTSQGRWPASLRLLPSTGSLDQISTNRTLLQAMEDVDWVNQANTAALRIRAGHHTLGFRILGDSLERYAELLSLRSPLLIATTYIVAFNLAGFSADLWASFLRYVAELSTIVLGPGHAFTRVARSWQAIGVDDFPAVCHTLHRGFVGCLARYVEGWGEHEMNALDITIKRVTDLGMMSVETLDRRCQEARTGCNHDDSATGQASPSSTDPSITSSPASLNSPSTPGSDSGNFGGTCEWISPLDSSEMMANTGVEELDRTTRALLPLRNARLVIRSRKDFEYFSFEQENDERLRISADTATQWSHTITAKETK